MKTFLNFIKEADVPTNVTGAVVSTDQSLQRNPVINILLRIKKKPLN
jgi:hypothetical protein